MTEDKAECTLDPDEVIKSLEMLSSEDFIENRAMLNERFRDIWYVKKEPKRRFSVMRGKVIYVCPTCKYRVHQFKERCFRCGQALKWDIRVK